MGILEIFGLRKVKVDSNDPNFDLTPSREYAATWERRASPSPGAMCYAYETLALAQYAPAGPSVPVRNPLYPVSRGPQMYVPAQSVYVQGIPTLAGQYFSGPLYNPATNSYGIRGG